MCPEGKELSDLGIDLRIHKLGGERAVRIARLRIPPHCHLLPPDRLDAAAKEGTEDVHIQQPIPEQAFEDVKHRPQLVDILLSDSVPLVGLSSWVPTRNSQEWCIDVILQEEPLPPPPGQWVGHRELEVWVDLTPSPDVNIDTTAHRRLHAWVMLKSDAEKVVP
jgi:hypothetical protein